MLVHDWWWSSSPRLWLILYLVYSPKKQRSFLSKGTFCILSGTLSCGLDAHLPSVPSSRASGFSPSPSSPTCPAYCAWFPKSVPSSSKSAGWGIANPDKSERQGIFGPGGDSRNHVHDLFYRGGNQRCSWWVTELGLKPLSRVTSPGPSPMPHFEAIVAGVTSCCQASCLP